MRRELEELEKLLDRKRKYLFSLDESTKAAKAITAEINIIENFIEVTTNQLLEQQREYDRYSELAQDKIGRLEEEKMKLEGICLLHGIDDLNTWVCRPKEMIINELLHDRVENYIRIPNQLKFKFYGEEK